MEDYILWFLFCISFPNLSFPKCLSRNGPFLFALDILWQGHGHWSFSIQIILRSVCLLYYGTSITLEWWWSSSVKFTLYHLHTVCSCSLSRRHPLRLIFLLIEDILESSCKFDNNGCSLRTARMDFWLGLKVCVVGSANSLQRTCAFQSWAFEMSSVHFSTFSEALTLHYLWTNKKPSDFLAEILSLTWKLEQESIDFV